LIEKKEIQISENLKPDECVDPDVIYNLYSVSYLEKRTESI